MLQLYLRLPKLEIQMSWWVMLIHKILYYNYFMFVIITDIFNIYTTFQRFGVGKINVKTAFIWSKYTVKTRNNVKYWYNLKYQVSI